MKRALSLSGRALLCALSVASCGTEIGNPVVDVRFALSRAEAPAFLLDTAFVSVERVRLRNAADCNGGAEFELEGPLAVDLLSPETPAALQNIEVSGGAYCRFEFAWHVSSEELPPEVPTELQGASLLFAGTRDDGVRIVLRSERADELRLDALDEAGFPISAATHALFVAFREDALFADIDFTSALPDAEGVVRIEPGQNDALLDQFEANLDQALRLFDDDNDSGSLDANEEDDDDTLAQPGL
jgi:hypothetical protein